MFLAEPPGEGAHELAARSRELLRSRSPQPGIGRFLDRRGHLENLEPLAVSVGEAARDAVSPHRLERYGVVHDLLLRRPRLRRQPREAPKEALDGPGRDA